MFFFFKQKTADEMRISEWSSDVCSSDLAAEPPDWQCVRRFSDEETHVRMHGRHVRIARMKDQRHSHRAKAAPGEFRTILRRRRRQAAAAHFGKRNASALEDASDRKSTRLNSSN